nr:winged helix-turn-helix domain-containing protein [Natrinema soli]
MVGPNSCGSLGTSAAFGRGLDTVVDSSRQRCTRETSRALQQLATEDESRELRPDELRYALGTLEPKQLCSDLPPTVGRIVQTLLTADSRLSQRELADRADVSARAVRNYRDRLEALDLICIDEHGYRLTLSFQTPAERRTPVVPKFSGNDQSLLDAADALLEMILPPERYGDPDDPLGSVLFWQPDPYQLLEHPAVGAWLGVAAAFGGTAQPGDGQIVIIGPQIKQESLVSSGTMKKEQAR